MFIEIEHLKPEPLHIRHTYGVSEVPLGREDATFQEPIVADFILTHKDRDLRLQGSVETAVRCQCARCLREFSRPVHTQFTLYYSPHPEVAEEEEIELKYEDLNIGFYDGIRFDVDVMIAEQIDLNLPMKLICSESCRGLCATCGSDLNAGSCSCTEEDTDPRLAVLLEFRKRMGQ